MEIGIAYSISDLCFFCFPDCAGFLLKPRIYAGQKLILISTNILHEKIESGASGILQNAIAAWQSGLLGEATTENTCSNCVLRIGE